MTKEKFPRFIQNKPHYKDKYEGRSAERVAKAIEGHIENNNTDSNDSNKLPQIIGLEGEWGSGKSNVIGILKNNIKEKYYLFEYDAWGHQEDLQRRSFLETLTDDLITAENGSLLPEKCSKKNDCEESETWSEKLTNLLARKRVTKLKSHPKISSGIIGAILLFILTPISAAIASDESLSICEKIFIAFIPIMIALLVWGIFSLIKWKFIWSELFEIYSNEQSEDVINETISEKEPSVKEFKDWMSDLSCDLQRKLIIVFDNMDRLPAEKVKELWSSIHTFFSENSYPNIWVIITFDKDHLANAFENEKKYKELARHFIKKTFPVIYRVAPPVLTDWKKIFNEFFEEAFGKEDDENKELIQRIFGIMKPHFTPRDIIAFMNELVSLKNTWQDDIPLIPIAIFALCKEKILESPVEAILSGGYLNSIGKLIDNTELLQGFISALTYGIDIKLAEQIPLMQYVQNTLKGTPNYDINKYSDNGKFVHILDDAIKNVDSTMLDSSCESLSMFNTNNGISLTKQWDYLVKIQFEQTVNGFTFNNTHKSLLINVNDENKIKLTKYLCDGYRNIKEFKGDLYYSTIHSLNEFISENKLKVNLLDLIKDKKVEPEVFISYSQIARDEYSKYKLNCDNKELNKYLVGLIPDSLPSTDFISFLKKKNVYTFDEFNQALEYAIRDNKINENNFPEIIKAYKLTSKERLLKQKLTHPQIQSLISTTDQKSDAYFDLVAMGLTNKIIDTAFVDGLDDKIAQRIEHYLSYGELLILSVQWGSNLLRKAMKKLTIESYGVSSMDITSVLPFYENIKTDIGVNDQELLKRLNSWSISAIERINTENLQAVIPNYIFYEHSIETKNDLTKHINDVASEKLKTIPLDELYQQRSSSNYYWHSCAFYLIKGDVLKSLPDNYMEFCKRILNDIANQAYAIPPVDSIHDVIISKADKRKLQPTIKSICDEFCNKPNSITPGLFMFFAEKFDFVNKMNSREGDISRNILSAVVDNDNCLNHILENSDGYIRIINEANEDAEDLKTKLKQIKESNQSAEFIKFFSEINFDSDQDETVEE